LAFDIRCAQRDYITSANRHSVHSLGGDSKDAPTQGSKKETRASGYQSVAWDVYTVGRKHARSRETMLAAQAD